jgi:hypothetical protein
MKHLVPESRHVPSGAWVAFVETAPSALPAFGSVSAMQGVISPVQSFGR